MPYKHQDLFDLREELDLTQDEFIVEYLKCAKRNGIRGVKLSRTTLWRYEEGEQEPYPKHIDVMYLLVEENQLEGYEFYTPARIAKKNKNSKIKK